MGKVLPRHQRGFLISHFIKVLYLVSLNNQQTEGIFSYFYVILHFALTLTDQCERHSVLPNYPSHCPPQPSGRIAVCP